MIEQGPHRRAAAMFRVGQRVVCVNQFLDRGCDEIQPKVGDVLTIRHISLGETDNGETMEGLQFLEIRNYPGNYRTGFLEVSFSSRAFRPVVEKKTDIGVFNEILNRENGHSPIFDPPIRKRKLKHAI
jgi:hypothetical protein